MKHIYLLLTVLIYCINTTTYAQGKITEIKITPYSDSVKIVKLLSYYVNVEGAFDKGNILPLSEHDVFITTTFGKPEGMSIFFEDNIAPPDSFLVKATLHKNKSIVTQKWLYVQKVNKDKYLNFYEENKLESPIIDSAKSKVPNKEVNTTKVTKKKKKRRWL